MAESFSDQFLPQEACDSQHGQKDRFYLKVTNTESMNHETKTNEIFKLMLANLTCQKNCPVFLKVICTLWLLQGKTGTQFFHSILNQDL